MRKLAVLILCALVLALPAVSAWGEAEEEAFIPLGDLKTQDIYGKAVDSSLIEGKRLVMVNVWATYCGPCIRELPGLGSLSRELADQGVMIVGLVCDCQKSDLSADQNQVKKARQIAESAKADYPHLLLSRDMYMNILTQIQVVPTTIFIDGSGRYVDGSAYTGSRDEAEWRQIIEELLARVEEQ